MSYWIFPGGGIADRVTCVLSPEGVMGEAAWTREVGYGTASTTEQPRRRQESTLTCSAARCFIGAPPLAFWFTLQRDSQKRRPSDHASAEGPSQVRGGLPLARQRVNGFCIRNPR